MVGVQIETVITLIVGTVTVAVTGGRVGGLTVNGERVGGVTVTVTVELFRSASFEEEEAWELRKKMASP